jgi:hypothetical protein
MDEDVKNKLEELERRLKLYEDRLSDFRWYITGFAALLGVIFSVISLGLNWNFSNERASVRDLMNDVKKEMGNIGSAPNLIMLAPNRQPIEGQEIPATAEIIDNVPTVYFDAIFQNTGEMSSGNLAAKFYTNDPLPIDRLSSDESGFKYESSVPEDRFFPKEYPGHFSLRNPTFLFLKGTLPPAGRYPVMYKIFYGNGKVYKASFFIIIPRR